MTPRLAYDRIGSVRTFDRDGKLHVEMTPLSKANICEYLGREIVGGLDLGLQSDKRYRLYRDPGELAKAAPTFNKLQVLEQHAPVSADEPHRELTVGATGESARFEAPFLLNSLVIWDAKTIDLIRSGAQREISAGYSYQPDMTPGEIDGEPYDGRMTNIVGNHIALVEKGRAGPDVLIADSSPSTSHTIPNKDTQMADNDTKDDDRKEEVAKDSLEDGLRALLGANASDDVINQIMKIANGEAGAAEDDADDAPNVAPPEPPAPVALASPPRPDPARDEGPDRRFTEADVNRMVEDRLRAHDAKRTAMDAAMREVRPLVGEVMGMDSAESIYGYALKQVGINPKGINSAGLRALVQTQIQAKQPTRAGFAQDAAPNSFGVAAPPKI